MEVTVEQNETNVAKVQFTVPKADFDKAYRQGIQQMRQRARLKGFRPGKAPVQLIEKHHGAEIKDDVKQHFLRQAYSQAVEDNSLKPMAHPRIQKDETDLNDDGSFGMEFEISLRPEVTLSEYQGMEIESELEPVTSDNVEEALEEFRRQQSRTEEAEGGIQEDGLALCTVQFLHGEDEVFRREGLRLSPQTAPPGVDGDAFKEALVGKNAGDRVELDMTLPDTLPDEEKRGQAGQCVIDISQAFNMVPPSDEELCELLDVEDTDALRAKVQESLEESAQNREDNRIETALLDRLIEACDAQLPEPVLEEQTQTRLQSLAQRLGQSGMPQEEIDKELESQKDTARDEAHKGLKALLVVETLGEKEDLMVTQEDLQEELQSIAERNQTSLDEVRKYYSENNLGQQMAIELLERKVRKYLRENAKVTQPS